MSIIHVGNGVYNQLGDGLILKGLCEPCTEGVYRPQSHKAVTWNLAIRADKWSNIIMSDDSNGYPRTSQFMRANPLKGAYGETL